MKELRETVLSEVDSMRVRLIEISDFLHSNPELPFQEHKAVELLSSEFEKHGFMIERGLAGLETAFRATCSGQAGGPTVALGAEYDATMDVDLPKPMHACGHNVNGAITVGAAIALSKVMPDLKGKLVVLGIPATEATIEDTGDAIMFRKGVFDHIDVCIPCVHAYDRTFVPSSAKALANIAIEFKGKRAWLRLDRISDYSDPSADKYMAVNALRTALLAFDGIYALGELLRKDTTIHGVITDGGTKEWVLPEHAAMRFQIQAVDRKYLTKVLERIENCASGIALAMGAEHSFAITRFYSELKSNRVLAQAFERNLSELGVEFSSSEPLEGDVSDLGELSQRVPTIHPMIAIGSAKVHTAEFAEAAASPKAREAVIKGAEALALTVLDVFAKPGLLQEIKQQFQTQ